MEILISFFKTDIFLICLVITVLILLVLSILNLVKLSKLNRKYKYSMKKLGNGKDIGEMLKKYIDTVDKVDRNNKEIEKYCETIDKNMSKCLQKVGLVRYNAFQDTGSDLSFTLALLDENNNGVVLNGIYSREMSNIYAKSVENGISKSTLSDEEKEAIRRAINL